MPSPSSSSSSSSPMNKKMKASSSSSPSTGSAPAPAATTITSDDTIINPKHLTSSDYYFDSYSHFGIHEEMLKDRVRTTAYFKAIMNNKHLFKDKIVLDIGSGTGILSMFAAKAGARKVYAIECSNIASQSMKIISDNHLSDTIQVIHGKMEDIQLDTEYVDIIISEWMGYFLLYESMLDTVIYARDKYLRPETGIMLPDKANLYIGCIEDGDYRKEKIDFWDNVYGFDFSCIKSIALTEPLVDVVNSTAVVTSTYQPILSLDLLTCKVGDLTFESNFELQIDRDDYIHAYVSYFDCTFTQVHKELVLSTSPFTYPTHWKQTVFYVKDPIVVHKGETITGIIKCCPNSNNKRDLDISIQHSFNGKDSQINNEVLEYRLR